VLVRTKAPLALFGPGTYHFGTVLQDSRELHNALVAKVPTKIDIGSVYTQDPDKRAAYKGDSAGSGFKPVERELVFDIDLTDYDDVRNSCSGAAMSKQCWSLMHVAIQVRSSNSDLHCHPATCAKEGKQQGQPLSVAHR
jgi:DNA primase catalytic subunit